VISMASFITRISVRMRLRSRQGRNTTAMKTWLGVLLACLVWSAPAVAQQNSLGQPDYSKNPEIFPRIFKPYVVQKVPVIQLTNSENLSRLIRGGKLSLSMAQLVTAVKENNLDILASTNISYYAQTDALRAKAGGAPRGGAGVSIPSSLFSGAIGTGVGTAGGLGSFSSAAITGGAKQVTARAAGTYDPTLLLGFSIDRTTSPLNTIRVSGVPVTSTNSTTLLTRYTQGFPSGTNISVTFNNMRQSSTQKSLLYNPNFLSTFTFLVTQNLLNGFGRATNGRFMEVTKNEALLFQESVRLQTNTTLASTQNLYWDVVAARENVQVTEQSLQVSRRLYEDNKVREAYGKISGQDLVTAESEVATGERNLISARATLQMREMDLKNAISKQIDASLGPAVVELTTPLPEPNDNDIPRLNEALATAMSNRAEIQQANINALIQDLSLKYQNTLLRPTLLVFAQFSSSGLNGRSTITDNLGKTIVVPGGIRQTWRQVGGWDFPDSAFGFSFSMNIRNSSALADHYRIRLESQQTATTVQRTQNSITLEVRKAVIGLVQSKAQVEAARKAVNLSRQSLAAEESKLAEGSSIPYEVIRRQRDLTSALYAEVQARVGYAKALVERDRVMGILDVKNAN
jgi:outer membrane protein TolC